MVTCYNSNWKLKHYFNSVHLVLILIIYGCKAVYGIFFFLSSAFFFNISFPTWLEVFLFRPVSLLPQVCLYFRSVFWSVVLLYHFFIFQEINFFPLLQAYPGDTAGMVLNHSSKAHISKSYNFFGFTVHIEVMSTLYCSLLNM